MQRGTTCAHTTYPRRSQAKKNVPPLCPPLRYATPGSPVYIYIRQHVKKVPPI